MPMFCANIGINCHLGAGFLDGFVHELRTTQAATADP